jgi:cephalosporin-C deacetylase
MTFKTAFILICAFFSRLFSTHVTAQPIDLASGDWKLKTGDDIAWATPQYDDSDWQSIRVGMDLKTALNTDFTGFSWYRRSVVIPSKLKKAAKKGGAVILHLGKIMDADETYFNGIKVGYNGSFPPDTVSAWEVPRVYIIPLNLIKWDEPNVIAVRVNNWFSGGGMYMGEYIIEAATWRNKFKILIENGATTNAFGKNEPIILNSQLANSSTDRLEGTLTCEIKTFLGKSVAIKSQEVKILRGRVAKAESFNFDKLEAGFYISHFTFKDKNGASFKEKKGFAVAPETLKIPATPPADFDEYWDKALKELADIEPNYQLTLLPKWTTSEVEVFELEMKSLGNVRVKGYYSRPKGKKNLPAVLNVQGYSSVMEPFDLDTNMAAVYLNIRGHGNSREDINPGFPGFLLRGLENKENYIYRGAFMDCVRAVDFLCSRAEVDTSRLAVSGGSQGGALSIATASLDKRIKFCLPDVPFLSDFPNYFKIANWPFEEFKQHVARSGTSWDSVYSVLSYIDIKNHAPRITCPVIMASCLFDDICPSAINFAAFNNLSSLEKAFYLYPESGHSVPAEHHALKMRWLYGRFGLLP